MPRFNKDPNPYAATSASGYLANGTSGFSGARVTGLTGMDRTTGFRVTQGGTSGQVACYAGYQAVAAAPGQVWSSTFQLRLSAAAIIDYYVVWFDSSGAQIGASAPSSLGTVVAGAPTRALASGAEAPARTAFTCGGAICSGVPGGATLTVTAHRIEQINDPNLVGADGASGNGWTWDGTAGSSTSTRAADDGGEWWALLSDWA